MPSKLRLRRNLKPIAPDPEETYPVPAPEQRPDPPITMPIMPTLPTTAVEAMENFNNALARLQMTVGLNDARQTRRLETIKHLCAYMPPRPCGHWREHPAAYVAYNGMLDRLLADAYRVANGGSQHSQREYSYTTVITVQSDVLFVFMDFSSHAAIVCRANDWHCFVELYHGVCYADDVNAILGEVMKRYLSSRRFVPDRSIR